MRRGRLRLLPLRGGAGQVEVLWAEAPGLSERDRRKGRQLACQCRPQGDVA
jgi:toluene monooxygenase electron transfer component